MTNDPDDKQDGRFVLLPIPSEDFPVLQPHPLPDRAAEGKPLLNRFITHLRRHYGKEEVQLSSIIVGWSRSRRWVGA